MAPDLVVVFISSFAGVFIVLIFLALAMQIIMRLFPAKTDAAGQDDAAMYAAIVSTFAGKFPGARVTKIEEVKNMRN
jgi:Na+-transporting methylmalonyl-CoA/oxaloacetate decarboxylase gamma subunit